MKSKGERISKMIRFSKELLQEFNEFCEEYGLIGNSVIEMAVIDFMKKHSKKKKEERL